MKKWLAATLVVIGLFAWFRFAADCFDPSQVCQTRKSSHLTADAIQPAEGISDTASIKAGPPAADYIRRPVHTKQKAFILAAIFIFVCYTESKRHVHFYGRKIQDLPALFPRFLRAPPTTA